jgi:molecular chaperone DnaK (HSP70)
MSSSTLVLGIDLGTSNSAVACCRDAKTCELLPILQTLSSDAQIERELLPSMLFALPEHEPRDATGMVPWFNAEQNSWVIGQYARERGASLPGRLVSSSKSWLCNLVIDRRAPILPWQGEENVKRISPVDAAVDILSHLHHSVALREGDDAASNARVVITIPASFEESARALTVEAAHHAGWRDVALLEEPLAALYSWLETHADTWRKMLSVGDVILVCDVGGGTSDFSLIAVTEEEGDLAFKRISVGDHILLGGDNMDLALAHILRRRLLDQGRELDQWQFASLVQGARAAKEALCSELHLEQYTVSIPSRGSGLFAGSLSVEIARRDVEEIVLDGFFPIVDIAAHPRERRATGLREFGLPYASDPAISKHLAAFLARSARNALQSEELATFVREGIVRPTKILFNGGVFRSERFRGRIVEQVNAWSPAEGVLPLDQSDLESAVAKGAAYYGGVVSSGQALRIRAGLSRSYYIGVEPSELAVPGVQTQMKGICVAPQGLEEGSQVEISEREFILASGESIEFKLFSSSERSADVEGSEVPHAETTLDDAGTIKATIESVEPYLPVVIHSRLSEVGTLEISLHRRGGEGAWRFEFDVRGKSQL